MDELESKRQTDLLSFNTRKQQVISDITETIILKRNGYVTKQGALDNIVSIVKRTKNIFRTEITTKVNAFRQIVNNFIAQKVIKLDTFQYVGPLDGKTRDFCKSHIGQVKTMEEWNALDNGQIAPVSIYKGGYNCRHQLIGVKK
jgi:hypothetical protein